jgi:hypothetical protein
LSSACHRWRRSIYCRALFSANRQAQGLNGCAGSYFIEFLPQRKRGLLHDVVRIGQIGHQHGHITEISRSLRRNSERNRCCAPA